MHTSFRVGVMSHSIGELGQCEPIRKSKVCLIWEDEWRFSLKMNVHWKETSWSFSRHIINGMQNFGHSPDALKMTTLQIVVLPDNTILFSQETFLIPPTVWETCMAPCKKHRRLWLSSSSLSVSLKGCDASKACTSSVLHPAPCPLGAALTDVSSQWPVIAGTRMDLAQGFYILCCAFMAAGVGKFTM